MVWRSSWTSAIFESSHWGMLEPTTSPLPRTNWVLFLQPVMLVIHLFQPDSLSTGTWGLGFRVFHYNIGFSGLGFRVIHCKWLLGFWGLGLSTLNGFSVCCTLLSLSSTLFQLTELPFPYDMILCEPGVAMVPINWQEMQCPVTLQKEFRKVAKVCWLFPIHPKFSDTSWLFKLNRRALRTIAGASWSMILIFWPLQDLCWFLEEAASDIWSFSGVRVMKSWILSNWYSKVGVTTAHGLWAHLETKYKMAGVYVLHLC
jgi:hypothetical protein